MARNQALVQATEEAVSVASERIIRPVAKGARHQKENAQGSPRTTQVEGDPEHRPGPNMEAFLPPGFPRLDQNQGIDTPERRVTQEDRGRERTLERCELELARPVEVEHEPHGPVAEAAQTVVEQHRHSRDLTGSRRGFQEGSLRG